MPLFQFARLNRIPMVALNVEREFVREVGASGFDSVALDKREGVTKPASASQAYLERLLAVYSEHPDKKERPTRTDPAFQRFVEAQLVWDRAMAQGLAEAAARDPQALVVGVMGSLHMTHNDGVPHQLANLGIKNVTTLLPWARSADCKTLTAGIATAVFGLPATAKTAAPSRPLLGITIDTTPAGVRVNAVSAGSVAEAAGLRVGDVLVEVAGSAVKDAAELRAIVGRTAPGTWLPMKARRQSETLELIAKFPAQK
jgi:hypothetical protein